MQHGSSVLQFPRFWFVLLKPHPSSLEFDHPIGCICAVESLRCKKFPMCLLKAFKRAAESLEKLMDATREELPGTMAGIRLSSMEISDLTMELSDLG